MTKDAGAYLAAIHDCIRRIRDYTKAGKSAYLVDTKTQDAVIRNIEVLGQAVRDFGIEELVSRNNAVPWKHIAGMRNILAHRYLGVDIEMTWEVVETHLDPVDVAIGDIAAQLGIRLPVFGS